MNSIESTSGASATRGSMLFSHLLGGMIYAGGDSIAALIAGQLSLLRLLGIFLVGASLYAFEIQRYFRWIESRVQRVEPGRRAWLKTGMALIYFNPLWIARHLAFVYLFNAQVDQIDLGILRTGLLSFAVNIPISLLANYWIQNKTALRYRFWASAFFSGLMAIYYSMSSVWF